MMLFEQNADFASACFGETLGRLVPGALADVNVVDYDPPTPLTAENINGHLLFGISGRSVVTYSGPWADSDAGQEDFGGG